MYDYIYMCIRGAITSLNIVRTADKIFNSVLRELRDNETSAWLRRWSTRDVERERERVLFVSRERIESSGCKCKRSICIECMYVCIYVYTRNDCFQRGCYYCYVNLSKAYNRLVTN